MKVTTVVTVKDYAGLFEDQTIEAEGYGEETLKSIRKAYDNHKIILRGFMMDGRFVTYKN